MPRIKIITKYCKACGLCVQVCPRNALRLSDTVSEKGVTPVEFDESRECSGCGLCYLLCPDAAIEVEKEDEACQKKS